MYTLDKYLHEISDNLLLAIFIYKYLSITIQGSSISDLSFYILIKMLMSWMLNIYIITYIKHLYPYNLFVFNYILELRI